MRPRRIFHGLQNISGIPVALARAERAAGLDSAAHCYATGFGFAGDRLIERGNPQGLLMECAAAFDVFNFHFGYGFFDQSLDDLEYLKRRGKVVNLFFHGCDVRDSKKVIATHAFSACKECWPQACNANRNAIREWASARADAILVSTPDLLEFFDRAVWLPQAVSIDTLASQRSALKPARKSGGSVSIAHAPSSPQLKGTSYVRKAVADLRASGVDVELVELAGLPHAEVLATMASCDLVVDQLLIGAYGVVTIEALAMGKPTICYIRDDLRNHYPRELPVISATILDLADVIADLIARRADWPSIGTASADYVAAVHDAPVVARRLARSYVD